jgi:hypothetical protein
MVLGKMVLNMEREFINGWMVIFMKVNFQKENLMEKEKVDRSMGIHMMGLGRMMLNMEKELLLLPMGIVMKDNFKTENSMEKE